LNKNAFLTLLNTTKSVIFILMGNIYKIVTFASGRCMINMLSGEKNVIYPSTEALLNNYMVNQMPLGSLTPWAQIADIS